MVLSVCYSDVSIKISIRRFQLKWDSCEKMNMCRENALQENSRPIVREKSAHRHPVVIYL